jgi:hypothetical protein
MAVLDSLKVDSAPAAFAPTAQAHNALVALVENMVGSGGVKVTVSAGRILIELSGTNLPSGGGGNLVTSVGGKTGDVIDPTFNTVHTGGLTVTGSPAFFNSISLSGGSTVTIGSDVYSVQTVSVCVGGVAKSMNVIGTTPA